MYSKKYSLNYEFGLHHLMIEVSEKEFSNVIDDLCVEFEIIKRENPRSHSIHYYVPDYCGHLHFVGIVSMVKDIEKENSKNE